MPFNLGMGEVLVVLIVALLVFGGRLPEVGRSLGRGVVEFKKGLKGLAQEANRSGDSTDGNSTDGDSADGQISGGDPAEGETDEVIARDADGSQDVPDRGEASSEGAGTNGGAGSNGDQKKA